jgi:hypothetical protein
MVVVRSQTCSGQGPRPAKEWKLGAGGKGKSMSNFHVLLSRVCFLDADNHLI